MTALIAGVWVATATAVLMATFAMMFGRIRDLERDRDALRADLVRLHAYLCDEFTSLYGRLEAVPRETEDA